MLNFSMNMFTRQGTYYPTFKLLYETLPGGPDYNNLVVKPLHVKKQKLPGESGKMHYLPTKLHPKEQMQPI